MFEWFKNLYKKTRLLIEGSFDKTKKQLAIKRLQEISNNSFIEKKDVKEFFKIIKRNKILNKNELEMMKYKFEGKLRRKLRKQYKNRFKRTQDLIIKKNKMITDELQMIKQFNNQQIVGDNKKFVNKDINQNNKNDIKDNFLINQYTCIGDLKDEDLDKILGKIEASNMPIADSTEWFDVQEEVYYDCQESNPSKKQKKEKLDFIYYENDLDILRIPTELENTVVNLKYLQKNQIIKRSNVPAHLEDEYYSKENVEKIHAYKDKLRKEYKEKYGEFNSVKLYNEIQNKLKKEKLLKEHNDRLEREKTGNKLYRTMARNLEPYEIEESSKWKFTLEKGEQPRKWRRMVFSPDDTSEEREERIEKLLEGAIDLSKRKNEDFEECKKIKVEDVKSEEEVDFLENKDEKTKEAVNEILNQSKTQEITQSIDENQRINLEQRSDISKDFPDNMNAIDKNAPLNFNYNLINTETPTMQNDPAFIAPIFDFTSQQNNKISIFENDNLPINNVTNSCNFSYQDTNLQFNLQNQPTNNYFNLGLDFNNQNYLTSYQNNLNSTINYQNDLQPPQQNYQLINEPSYKVPSFLTNEQPKTEWFSITQPISQNLPDQKQEQQKNDDQYTKKTAKRKRE